MAAKKVLIVAYYFPPLGGAGVQRILKFVKYLPQFGWEPVVLSVKDIDYPALDESLLKEIPASVEILRSGSFDPQRFLHLLKAFSGRKNEEVMNKASLRSSAKLNFLKWFFIPDSKNGWLPFALLKGMKILKDENIDLIFSSSPPVSAHLAAYWLSKISGKPLVIDLRDPWELVEQEYSSLLHKQFNQNLQRKIFGKAKYIITVNHQIGEKISENCSEARVDIITNGFDPEDFLNMKVDRNDKFEIVYAGTFNRLNDPRPFLGAYAETIKENREFSEKATFTKVGLVLDWDWQTLLKQYGIEKHVTTLGYLSHRESVAYLLKGKILLLTTGGKTGSPLLSTGKIYEYLATGKPILAIVPLSGAAAELLREYSRAIIVVPQNKHRINQALLNLFEQYKTGKLEHYKPSADLTRFERKYQTQRLAQIFNRCLDER